MDKEYIVYKDTLIEALDHLDQFKTKMDNFIKTHPKYNYEDSIEESNNLWEIKIKVNKDEQINIKTT